MPEYIGRRILLVEDEAVIAMSEKMELEKFGYAVRTVTTGEKAVEAVKTTTDIDLILMDINLGNGIDGTQAAEIILKSREIPVVFLSSHTDPAIVGKMEKITSYGYVVKSSSITVLDASIKMALKLFDAVVKENEKEESLRRSEQKYKTLFNEMLDGFALHEIICDSAGVPVDYRFLDVNPVFERMTGLKAADIMGRTVLEVMPGTENYWKVPTAAGLRVAPGVLCGLGCTIPMGGLPRSARRPGYHRCLLSRLGSCNNQSAGSTL